MIKSWEVQVSRKKYKLARSPPLRPASSFEADTLSVISDYFIVRRWIFNRQAISLSRNVAGRYNQYIYFFNKWPKGSEFVVSTVLRHRQSTCRARHDYSHLHQAVRWSSVTIQKIWNFPRKAGSRVIDCPKIDDARSRFRGTRRGG